MIAWGSITKTKTSIKKHKFKSLDLYQMLSKLNQNDRAGNHHKDKDNCSEHPLFPCFGQRVVAWLASHRGWGSPTE